MKKLLTLALIALSFIAKAQDSETKPKTPIGGRPNIPNDLNIEFGFNQLTNRPADLSLNFFGSRSFHVYYQVPIKIFGEKSGFTVNPGFGIGSEKFSFQPEIMYSRQGYSFGDDIVALNYLNIPLMGKYYITKGFSVEAGPQIGFLLSAKNEKTDVKDLFNTFDFGLNFGLGYKFENGLNFGARYNLGLTDINNVEGSSSKNKKVFQRQLVPNQKMLVQVV